MISLEPPKIKLSGLYQQGITTPQWPILPQGKLKSEAEYQQYRVERAGRIDPQQFMTILTADTKTKTREEFIELLKDLTSFINVQITRKPDKSHVPILKEIPESWRVTITLGFGSSVFMTRGGDDRFGLIHAKPLWLREMPKVTGDVYDPAQTAADFIFVIQSDHPYVNVSIARALSQGYWNKPKSKLNDPLVVRTVDQGFSRPDKREFLRFDDGIDNLSNANNGELDKFVFVTEEDKEPEWAMHGTYLVWRKIRENLPVWEAFSEKHQEQMIGRKKKSGKPLSRKAAGPGRMTPVYPNPAETRDGALTAHIRKVQPRRPGPDLFDFHDLDRRFLRRAYPFFEGFDSGGQLSTGLLFLAFMKNLRKQFEWPVFNWQTNPDFPVPGTGIDALYGKGILSNLTGGYYFCPGAVRGKNDFFGSGMFE